jgi:hypothetical protein
LGRPFARNVHPSKPVGEVCFPTNGNLQYIHKRQV